MHCVDYLERYVDIALPAVRLVWPAEGPHSGGAVPVIPLLFAHLQLLREQGPEDRPAAVPDHQQRGVVSLALVHQRRHVRTVSSEPAPTNNSRQSRYSTLLHTAKDLLIHLVLTCKPGPSRSTDTWWAAPAGNGRDILVL